MHSSRLFAEFDPAPERFVPAKIVSGGQTGVDRGALDAALALGIEHGGWCPAGRLAEDGRVPTVYRLVETDSSYYPDRTEKNVRDSDATLILYRGRMTGGTKLTKRLCQQVGRPELSISITDAGRARDKIVFWLNQVRPEVLNVAGPRESNAAGIQHETYEVLVAALT